MQEPSTTIASIVVPCLLLTVGQPDLTELSQVTLEMRNLEDKPYKIIMSETDRMAADTSATALTPRYADLLSFTRQLVSDAVEVDPQIADVIERRFYDLL